MTNGQQFTFKGKLYRFDRYFQYSNSEHVLIAAKRWVKTKQKFSGVSLLVGRKNEIEKDASFCNASSKIHRQTGDTPND